MNNILCLIDFSDVTEKVVKEAASLARAFSCKLWMLHVAAPEPAFVGYEVGPQHVRDWRSETLHDEHKYIQTRARELQDEGIDSTPLLVKGGTIEAILAETDKLDIDMIVMGSHGHGPFHSVLVGSTTHGVIHSVTCPVVLVSAKQ
jgi:nucleotide-binding universal stress UspA family protein